MSNKEDSIGKLKKFRLYLPQHREIIKTYGKQHEDGGCVFHDGQLYKVLDYKIMSKDCVEFTLKPELFNVSRQTYKY